MRARPMVAVAATLALAAGAGGCGGSDEAPSTVVTAGDNPGGEGARVDPEPIADQPQHRAAIERLARRGSQVDRGFTPWDDLTDMLPNKHYAFGGSTGTRPVSARVIVGKVLDAQPGRGFAEAKKVDPRRVHLTVRVLDELGDSADDAAEVRVGVVLNPGEDLALVRAALTAVGRFVIFLATGSAVFDYDPDLYSIPNDQGLLTMVQDDGRLELPGYDGVEEAQWLSRAATLDELKLAAQRPAATQEVPAP